MRTNCRERILAAIDHKTPDILPVGFKASVDVIAKLQKHFGVKDVEGLVAALPVDTHGLFNNCMTGVFPLYTGGPKRLCYPATYFDGTFDTFYGYKRRWVQGTSGRNEEVITHPLEKIETIEDLEKYNWPQADWFDYSTINKQCQQVGDKAIVFLAGSIGQTANLIGFERLMGCLATDPDYIQRCFSKLSEFFCELTSRTLQAAKGRIDIICVQDDFGMQSGPMISLDMYRRYFKPHHQEIFEVAHRYGAKVMMHSCGAVSSFIGEFIDIGVDILDPVQINAEGMAPKHLKQEFGKHICFHGGLDTQHTLLTGTPDDVRNEINKLLYCFAGQGGYILAPSHYIQSDTPWDNLMAIFDHVNSLN